MVGTRNVAWVIEHWLRTLPKNKRRSLVPLPDKDDLCERLLRTDVYRQGRFLAVLSGLLEDMYRLRVDAEDWDVQRLLGTCPSFAE